MSINRPKIRCAALALVAAIAVAADAQTPPSGAAETGAVKMTARKYEFSPNAIRVKKGDHVTLIITALDRDHGFKIEAFHVEEKLPKGEAVTIEFTAGEAGTFPFQCSHFCGLGHKKMKGELIVE